MQKYTNYRLNVRLKVHIKRLSSKEYLQVIYKDTKYYFLCKAKPYFYLECFNKIAKLQERIILILTLILLVPRTDVDQTKSSLSVPGD